MNASCKLCRKGFVKSLVVAPVHTLPGLFRIQDTGRQAYKPIKHPRERPYCRSLNFACLVKFGSVGRRQSFTDLLHRWAPISVERIHRVRAIDFIIQNKTGSIPFHRGDRPKRLPCRLPHKVIGLVLEKRHIATPGQTHCLNQKKLFSSPVRVPNTLTSTGFWIGAGKSIMSLR